MKSSRLQSWLDNVCASTGRLTPEQVNVFRRLMMCLVVNCGDMLDFPGTHMETFDILRLSWRRGSGRLVVDIDFDGKIMWRFDEGGGVVYGGELSVPEWNPKEFLKILVGPEARGA